MRTWFPGLFQIAFYELELVFYCEFLFAQLLNYMRTHRVNVCVLSPPCTMFSQLMRTNFGRMKPDDLKRRWKDALCFMGFTMDIILYLISINGIFVFEHPTGASSWKLKRMQALLNMKGLRRPVRLVTFHQCRFGLVAPVSKKPIRKSTRFLTNSQMVASTFDRVFCQCDVEHRQMQGSEGKYKLSKFCEQYPPELCKALVASLAKEVEMSWRGKDEKFKTGLSPVCFS